VWAIVEEGNRFVEAVRPWELARAERADGALGARLDSALGVLVAACRRLGEELAPFLPGAAARIAAQCGAPSGRLPDPEPLFPRIGRPERAALQLDQPTQTL
jgi:methionyl-tRNA synthetase